MQKKISLIGFYDGSIFSSLSEGDLYQCTDLGSNVESVLQQLGTTVPDLYVINDEQLGGQVTSDLISSIHEVYKTPVIRFTNQTGVTGSDHVYIVSADNSSIMLNEIIKISLAAEDAKQKLQEELNMHKMQVEELSETNAHLITATFRERSLKKELEASKALIEEQSKKILDSINYSLRIQQSIIPSNDVFAEALGDHFVYYKPKDVVSGDFPWMLRKGPFVYFAAVDCTGHGVPGAMMSMIGNLLLNSIVMNGDQFKTPSEILLELHQSVVRTLKQDAEGNKAADGMDAALCRINFETGELLFSGAHLPLFLLRKGELEVFKGDKFPVGGMQYRNRNTYSDHSLLLEKEDRIFVFSDGIIDQVGGPENIKWMSASLKDFIVANASLSMSDMKEEVHRTFEEYKGANKQVDDVLLIGLQY